MSFNFEPLKDSVVEHTTINLNNSVDNNQVISKLKIDGTNTAYFHFISDTPYKFKVHFNKELGGYFICTNPNGTNPNAPCCMYEEPAFWINVFPVIHYENLSQKGEVVPGVTDLSFKCLTLTASGMRQMSDFAADEPLTAHDFKGKKDGNTQQSPIRYSPAGKSRIDNPALKESLKKIEAIWNANNDGSTIIKFVAKSLSEKEYLEKRGTTVNYDDSDIADNNPFAEDEDF